MIFKRHIHLTFVSLEICSKIGFYPVNVSGGNGSISYEKNPARKVLHWLQMLFCIVQAFVNVYRIGEIIWDYDSSSFAHLPCPMACTSLALLMLCDYIVIFKIHPEFYLKYMKDCFNSFPDDGQKRLTLKGLSRQELFAIFIWPILLGVPVLHVLIFLVLPNGPNYIYYNVPENLKNPFTFLGCAVLEGYLLTLWLSIGLFVAATHVMTFQRVVAEMDTGVQAIGDSIRIGVTQANRASTLREEWKRCRRIELNLKIFNEANCTLQCAQVLWYFAQSTMLGYFGIRLVLEDVLLGTAFLAVGAVAASFYILVYERAFAIPIKMNEYKNKMKELACACHNGIERAVMKRNVDSVHCAGIKVGRMYVMDRLSALVFVDFVFRNVLALLIAH